MTQPTIYDQYRELKGMIYDNQRIINAHLAEIEKRIELLENNAHLAEIEKRIELQENASDALKLIVEVNSRYLQSIDRMYAELHGKTPLLTPEEPEPQHHVPVDYGLPELNKLMETKFGKGINREDYIFPLLKNEYINYSVHKKDKSKTYYPLKRGRESGWISDDATFVRVTQKGLSELIAYLISKGWVEVEE